MIQEVKLPEVSENIASGDVVKVLVKVGDTIQKDQPIIELETEKAMFEVPSTAEGKIVEINVKEGESVNIGAVIIKVETNGEAAEDGKNEAKQEVKKQEEKKEETKPEEQSATEKKEVKKEEAENIAESEQDTSKKESAPAAKEKAEPKQKEPERKPAADEQKNEGVPPAASPSVRRLARELGVDIHKVSGSGARGRISEEDVKAFVKHTLSNVSQNGGMRVTYNLPDFSKWGNIRKEPMTKVRKITMESMSHAWQTPMVTHFDEADITSLEDFRKKFAKEAEAAGGQLTVTSILVKVVTEALKKFPQFNSSINPSSAEIIYKDYYNIGIAADTDRGLLVPVVKEADKKNLLEISADITALAEKARNKKITPDEMEGGTFTISNLGGIGGTGFSPIVYSPQVAILGVSRASHKAVYKDGTFIPRFVLPLALTYDHRIIDGADAARFLRWICNAVENPFVLLLAD